MLRQKPRITDIKVESAWEGGMEASPKVPDEESQGNVRIAIGGLPMKR
jgi:hypothetical protein